MMPLFQVDVVVVSSRMCVVSSPESACQDRSGSGETDEIKSANVQLCLLQVLRRSRTEFSQPGGVRVDVALRALTCRKSWKIPAGGRQQSPEPDGWFDPPEA